MVADTGQYHVFPFAWDSRNKDEGGQRWFVINQDEDIKANDRLHWQQPLQNWHGMCADCHSDGLQRHYQPQNNQFASTWDHINVGCQSCHGKMSEHANSSETKRLQQHNVQANNPHQHKSSQPTGSTLFWQLTAKQKIAQLLNQQHQPASKSEKQRHQQVMQPCFACHSLRTPLTDGFSANKHFLDQFSPTLLQAPYYYADGQIKEEVYVYGSFLQSKMYEAGVTCLNCHDSHTLKVKAKDNSLCLQCHNSEVYQQETHTNHDLNSAAGQCVTCHMPATTYMGVDARRDHSFKIPRPDLSITFNTPNVCTNCHKNKTNQWASKQLLTWFAKTKTRTLTDSENDFLKLLAGQAISLTQHIAIINDKQLPEIKRASALNLLPNTVSQAELQAQPQLLAKHIQHWVNSSPPLIRLAMANIGYLLTPQQRRQSYQQLLSDELRAIRVSAANHLIGIELKNDQLLQQAVAELTEANQQLLWRGEGHLQQSLLAIKQGNYAQALAALKQSIKIDPYFSPAYVNLAELYRSTGQLELEKNTYLTALKAVPKSAPVYYAYGLYLIRSKQKLLAVNAFKKAMQFQPDNAQYAYLYFLALDATGKTQQAIIELKQQIEHYQNNALIQLGISFSQKIQDKKSYDYFIGKMK